LAKFFEQGISQSLAYTEQQNHRRMHTYSHACVDLKPKFQSLSGQFSSSNKEHK